MCQPIWKEYAHARFSEQFFDNGPEISKKSDANFLKKYWKSQMESIILLFARGCSLAGKALASQVKDRGFESRHLHWKTGSSPVRVLPVFSVSICFFLFVSVVSVFLFCFPVVLRISSGITLREIPSVDWGRNRPAFIPSAECGDLSVRD